MQEKINIFFKRNIFGTQNLFRYFLFNKIFKLLFTNRGCSFKNLPKEGFIRLNRINEKVINKINNEINNQNIENKNASFNFKVDDKLNKIFHELINENLKNDLDNLRQVYNFNFVISNIEIKRNYFFEKKNLEFKNVYSENYHEDKYICTQIKQFIYLSNVGKDNGPFSFFKIKDSRKFVKENKLENRFNFKIQQFKGNNISNEFFFLGKPGDTLLVDTSELLHRANIPSRGNYRDMLTITYNLTHDKKYNDVWSIVDNNVNFWKEKDQLNYSKKFSKPAGYYNLVLVFLKFLFLKINFIKY